MKKLILILLAVSSFGFSQELSNEDFIKLENEKMFTTLGNNYKMWFSCENNCTEITVNITDKYYWGFKTTKKLKKQISNTLIEQYTYIFLKKGFTKITINFEGIEPIYKELKLNR